VNSTLQFQCLISIGKSGSEIDGPMAFGCGAVLVDIILLVNILSLLMEKTLSKEA